MPLHDWARLPGWEGVHHLWLSELLHWVKPRLPARYRTYLGTTPTFTISGPVEDRPDIGVRTWPEGEPAETESTTTAEPGWEPDQEITVATLSPEHALHIERDGRLVASIELVSPRNKDRTAAQRTYSDIYTSYLLKGVNLMLVDVHRLPVRFSFADRIAAELGIEQPPSPAPFANVYRVGEPSPDGGKFLALWRRALTVGQPLPTLPLPLTVSEAVPIDLEGTYARAAEAAYLE